MTNKRFVRLLLLGIALAATPAMLLTQAGRPPLPSLENLGKVGPPEGSKPIAQAAAAAPVDHEPSLPRSQAVIPPGAPLRFDQIEHDFGKIDDFQPVTHVFRFENTAERPVAITQIAAACECTVPEVTKTAYAPGEQGEFSVTYKPRLRRGKERKPVTIHTDYPGGATIQLFVVAEVNPLLFVEPTYLWSGEVERDTTSALRRVTVTARFPEFAIADFRSRDPRFRIRHVEREALELEGQPAIREVLEVQFHADHQIGPARSSLLIVTNDPRHPPMSIALAAEVLGPLVVSPRAVFLRVKSSEGSFRQSISVVSRSGTPFRILSARTEGPPEMKLSVSPGPKSARSPAEATLLLEGNAASPGSPTHLTPPAAVILMTDMSDMREIRIPVTVQLMLDQLQSR